MTTILICILILYLVGYLLSIQGAMRNLKIKDKQSGFILAVALLAYPALLTMAGYDELRWRMSLK